MLSIILRRLLSSVPTLAIVVTLSFFMMRVAPGGPFDFERQVPPQVEENLKKAYNLDLPLWEQYGLYVWKAAQGDFGPSFKYPTMSVTDLIATGFPVSARLGGLALVLAVTLGVGLGTFAAMRQNHSADFVVMGFAMTGIAVPNYVMAPLLTLIFGVYLHWLPVGSWGDGDFKHIVLPVVALALPQVAYISRLTRGSMIEVLHQNYIRTARAKGLRERLVITRHALKGALLPVVSYLGPAAAGLLTGSVVIETIFGLPGIGRYFVQGALNRDYTLVMGTVIFYGALIILLNLIVDLLYTVLDPKVRYD